MMTYNSYNENMNLSEGASRILNIIAEKVNRSTGKYVTDKEIIKSSSPIPAEEVYIYLGELEGLGLILRGLQASGAEFRMLNITKEGLEETSSTQHLR
jgi:hypothetical protein